MKGIRVSTLAVFVASSILAASPDSVAQYNERPDLAGSGSPAVDCSGRSIKNKRVRAIHETDADVRGGTAYFIKKDPFLAYQLGRNINFREFRDRDGIFDLNIAQLAGPMPDGTTAKITANNQTSCVGCHNLPQGNPGGGASFSKDSGRARNSPHYFGAGIVEMLALQVRADMLRQLDSNGDGWINAREAADGGDHLFVQSGPKGPKIDYGRPALSSGRTGTPEFNNIFHVWYVDRSGKVVEGATEVDGSRTMGYNFEMIVWGWGQGRGRAALNPTNRAFLWDPFKAHSGLEAYDPTTNTDMDRDGISDSPTIAGAIQFPVTHTSPDKGRNLDRLGFSRDDPDGDEYLNEISEGDLDLAEFFMLNAPRPAFAGNWHEYRKGVQELHKLGCTECHVANWQIRSQDQVFEGDRRLFDLRVRWSPKSRRLEGRLVRLYKKQGDRFEPRRGSFEVVGLFTDLRHHDLGEEAQEIDFGGNVNRLWRTPPLWGVGSGFPWMHDGQSLSIQDAIQRHGGEAAKSRAAWHKAGKGRQNKVLNLLSKLRLYDIESLPADINGDGVIEDHFPVAGMDTERERFNAEWLFNTPVKIQGPFVNTDGVRVNSFAGVNLDDAYGQRLRLRIDSDDDGWPDLWDHAPNSPGYKDGVR